LKISGSIYCNSVAVLDNGVQRKIFGPKREEVTGEWKRPRKEDLYYLVKVKPTLKSMDRP
jgi:hypothetical protein